MLGAGADVGESSPTTGGSRGGGWNGARICAALVVALAVASLYGRTLGFGFVFDDLSLIDAHGPVRVGNDWLAYRPVRYASYLVDHWLGAGRPWAYHATNVALHLASSLLVLSIARRLALGWVAAACAACAFAMHPLGVEAVAYVAGRRDVLALALGLASVRAWMQPGWSWLAVASLAAAAGAKESGLVFAAVLAFASVCRLARAPSKSLPLLAVAGTTAGLLVIAYGAAPHLLAGLSRWSPASQARLAVHYASAAAVLRGYAADYPELAAAAATGRFAGGILAVALAAALAASWAWCVRAGRAAAEPAGGNGSRQTAFLGAWLVASAVATVALAGFHEPGADRHAYPLVAALALLLASLASAVRAADRSPAMRAAGAAAALALAAALVVEPTVTRRQVEVWRDSSSLWQATAAARPSSVRARTNLAGELAERGRVTRARAQLRRALALDPAYAPAYLGLAWLACKGGYPRKADEHLLHALALGADAEQTEVLRSSCGALTHTPAFAGSTG